MNNPALEVLGVDITNPEIDGRLLNSDDDEEGDLGQAITDALKASNFLKKER